MSKDNGGPEITEAMVVAAARALCKQHAKECNVNEQDAWNLYCTSFRDDALEALEAARGAK